MKKIYAIALVLSFMCVDMYGKRIIVNNNNAYKGTVLSINGTPISTSNGQFLEIVDGFTVTFAHDKTDYTYKVTLAEDLKKMLKNGELASFDLKTDGKELLARATYSDFFTTSKLPVEKVEKK